MSRVKITLGGEELWLDKTHYPSISLYQYKDSLREESI